MDINSLKTVLIVDDNPSNLKLLHELLSHHGYRVRVADSPILGLESALNSPPDLILLDIKMPEMDGYEVCQNLKKNKATASIPIIFISASAGALNKVKAFEVGGMDYISKPFDAAEVLARIENHLQLSILQKQTQKSLVTSQHMLEAIMNNSPAGICIKDLEGRYLLANREFERVMGIKLDEILGKTDHEVFPKEIADTLANHDIDVVNGTNHKQFEDTINNGEGKQTYLTLKFPLKDSGENNYAICSILTDISMRKRIEAELEHLATYDTLTGLPNRSLFMELLSRTLASSDRVEAMHALLFIDLDNFKNVNDSMGHPVGDMLLREVAQRLQKCIRGDDTVARMGGDEFVLLLQRIKHPSDAAEVSSKIIQALTPVFDIGGRNVFITPSIGIVISPENGKDAQNLLRNADTAMYHSKSKGRNTYQFFTEEMNQRVLQRMEIEKELRIALKEKTIVPFYQPKIDTKTGAIIGVEALSRWHHPEQGDIPPEVFIPVAEEANLIITLDRYILETSIKQFSPLIKKGLFKGTVAVNLTAHHFYRDHLLQFVSEKLDEYDFPADHLELEITEGSVMKNASEAIQLMHQLHDRGIQLSIDDFGTGYSSLSYLKQFPVKSLKIDVSFIHDLNTSDTDKNLVASIISLAHGLNLECIAEGVEIIPHAKILHQLECDTLQGFLFSPAIEFDSINNYLKDKKKFTDYLIDN
jgi:diguanylate cyclase (GGDEF)-like protein/PAS domain S-box-containing protein